MRNSIFLFAPAIALAVACGAPATPTVPTTVAVPSGVVRYLVGGDSRDDKAHVLPWAFREAKSRGATAFLFLGDMELTPQLDAHFNKQLPLLDPVPFYPVLGNHEVKLLGFAPIGGKAALADYRATFLGTQRTPVQSAFENKVVYSVNLPGALHFVALDNVSQNGFGEDQLAWLAKDLEAARADAKIRHIVVGMHKPLAKNGVSTHGMDKDGEKGLADSAAALDLFVKAKVTLIVASHVHEFAHTAQGGIPMYITGGLGAPLDNSGPEHSFHHVLVLDVKDAGISVDVLRFDGTPSMGTEEIDD
jgi:hypothetical protein